MRSVEVRRDKSRQQFSVHRSQINCIRVIYHFVAIGRPVDLALAFRTDTKFEIASPHFRDSQVVTATVRVAGLACVVIRAATHQAAVNERLPNTTEFAVIGGASLKTSILRWARRGLARCCRSSSRRCRLPFSMRDIEWIQIHSHRMAANNFLVTVPSKLVWVTPNIQTQAKTVM